MHLTLSALLSAAIQLLDAISEIAALNNLERLAIQLLDAISEIGGPMQQRGILHLADLDC